MTQSVWDIAIQQNRVKRESVKEVHEPTLLFIGSKNGGKTTIIHRFLERDDRVKPTLALDYTFGRKSAINFAAKSVVHIWELGGGSQLADLIDITINPENVLNLTMILVLDLSKPEELWDTMEKLLDAARRRYRQLVSRASQRELVHLQKSLCEMSERKSLSGHPDRELLDPFPLQFIMVGSKFDLFLNLPSEQQKIITRTLRFLNLYYGSSLFFISNKDEATIKRLKNRLSRVAFGGSDSPSLQLETGKPLVIPEGMDSFSNIGTPPTTDFGSASVKTPLDMWKVAFCTRFTQKSSEGALQASSPSSDPSKDPQFAEPLVDAALKIKDEEFVRSQRQNERRMRDLLQQAISDGIVIA
ncbi:unnamed protein product [Calicophoron daubneyi]|uniref:Cytoplasmic dynein 2 light intermediate chain 1 n=1 Tax=Calicophoron daubneyi TaxID=300641 RepID=A0AAV2T0A4_CALDB